MDENDLREALKKLDSASQSVEAAPIEPTTVSDPHQFVTIAFGANAEVRIDRALCPEPDRRDQLERAMALAIESLVKERESTQRALGEEIGRAVREGAQADLAEPMAAFEERTAGVKEQLQTRLARIERRKARG